MPDRTLPLLQSPRVAVLGLSLELYHRAVPQVVARYREQLERFTAPLAGGIEMPLRELCWTRDQVDGALSRARDAQVDAALIVPLSYTASLDSVPALRRCGLPLMIWNTQEATSIGEDYAFDDLLMNHVAQGTQDVASLLVRDGCPFALVTGHYADHEAQTRVIAAARAARAAAWARRMRVGCLGRQFIGMGDFACAPESLPRQWGPTVLPLTIDQFVAARAAVGDAECEARMADDRERFAIAPEVTIEIHRESARLGCALRRLVAGHRLDAFTFNFLDLVEDGRLRTLPFLGINQLCAEGLGYAGEGDYVTAAHHAQVRWLCGSAVFTEIYTIDYERRRLLMTHMQECNPALARTDRPVRLVRKESWAPGVQPYVGMHFTLAPGPVTLTNIVPQADGRFRYLTYETEIVDRAPLPRFDIPHWQVQLGEAPADFLTRYSLLGGTHHLVATPGHHAADLACLARLQGFACEAV